MAKEGNSNLVRLDVQEDIFHQVQEDAEKIVKTELKKVFKEINKEIKIK